MDVDTIIQDIRKHKKDFGELGTYVKLNDVCNILRSYEIDSRKLVYATYDSNKLIRYVDLDYEKNSKGTYKGYCKIQLTIEWLSMDNGRFFNRYGFSFVPSKELRDFAWDLRKAFLNKYKQMQSNIHYNIHNSAISPYPTNPLLPNLTSSSE